MSNLAQLEEARNTARAIATHPKLLELRGVLSSPTATAAEKLAAKNELAALRPERDKLRVAGGTSVRFAQKLLSKARREQRGASVETLAAKLREETTEQLEERRAKLEGERRALKLNHRAVVKVLGERDAEKRITDLVATMSDADKRALLQQLQVSSVESAEKVGTPGAS